MLPSCSSRDLVLTVVSALITFGTACAGPRVVDDPVRLEQVREAIARFEPKVIELLGTRLDREYEVHILAEETARGAPANTRYPSRDIYFAPSAFQEDLLERAVAHELVHVHATGVWDALPEVVEQGLAEYVGHLARGLEPNYVGAPPDLAKLVATLRMSDVEYMLAAYDRDVFHASTWLVCQLGVEGTRRLAQLLAERGDEHVHVLTTAAALEARSR